MATEEWRVIPGFSRYEVSSLGHVRHVNGRVLKGINSGARKRTHLGYLRVGIREDMSDGSLAPSKLVTVHSLVGRAFIGQIPENWEHNHKDGNKTNNAVANLEFVTASDNQKHATRTGLRIQVNGSRHGRSKINEATVLKIRAMRENTGATMQVIADTFGVSIMTVCFICNRKTWRHI